MSADEQVLREALRARAEQVDTVDDFVLPSVGLARRRARRAAAAAVTAAALVVGGLSVATWAATTGPPTPRPVPATATSAPPEQSPTPTPSAAPSVPPSPSGTPSSATPSATSTPVTGYAVDGTIHLPGGSLRFPDDRLVTRVEPLAGGEAAVTVVDPAGRERSYVLTEHGIVFEISGSWLASPDGTLIAMRPPESDRVLVVTTRGELVHEDELPRGQLVHVDRHRVVIGRSEGPSTVWDFASGDHWDLPRRASAVAADFSLVAGSRPQDDGSSCWWVAEPRSGGASARTVHEECHRAARGAFRPAQFSPDGRYLVGVGGFVAGNFRELTLVRTSDWSVRGTLHDGDDPVVGWGVAFTEASDALLVSRNSSDGVYPARTNDLVRCDVARRCVRVGEELRTPSSAEDGRPQYVVARPLVD